MTHNTATIQIYVGTDRSQRIGLQVLEYSIAKHTQRPFQIHSLEHVELPEPTDKRQLARTGFSFSRFAIPKLAGNKGKAIYMDADMLVFSDIGDLWDIPMNGHKMLIQSDVIAKKTNTRLFKKKRRPKQTAVCVLDCGRLEWNAEDIIAGLDGQYTYKELMNELCILEDHELGYAIPPQWNSLEYWDDSTCNLHFTDMHTQPWVSAANKHGHLWVSTLHQMLQEGAISRESIETEIKLAYARPSLLEELNDISRTNSSVISEQNRKKYHGIDEEAGFVPHKQVIQANRKRERLQRSYQASIETQTEHGAFERFMQRVYLPLKQVAANEYRAAQNKSSVVTRARKSSPLKMLLVANSTNLPTLQLAFTHPLRDVIDAGDIECEVLTELDIGAVGRVRGAGTLVFRTYADRVLSRYQPDLVVFCRYTGQHAQGILRKAKQQGARVVCCLDDNLLDVPLDIGLDKHKFYSDPVRQERLRYQLREADLIYSATPSLSEALKSQRFNTPIHTAQRLCPGQVMQTYDQTQPLRFGYMGFGHEQDLALALDGIVAVLDQRPEAEFELLGTIPKPHQLERFGDRVRVIPPDWNYDQFLSILASRRWSVGLCPLSNIRFNRHKSNTKWLEYSAVGASVVASNHSVYREVIGRSRGTLVSNPADWGTILLATLDNAEMRRNTVQAAQRHIEAHYSNSDFLNSFKRMLNAVSLNFQSIENTPA
ncbi:MAG: glycosyltransferase [Pseudomonadales bacterium]